MGLDVGFDMVPPLSKETKDAQDWANFLHCVRGYYKDDPNVVTESHYITFEAGEHPMLPFEGHKFLRFSSNLTGSNATGVYEYIEMVTAMAKMIFGHRVYSWSEAADQHGFYGWDKVYSARKTWGKPDEPESNALLPTTAELGRQATSDQNPDLFEVQQIPGKGRSLIALRDIAKGTRILHERPLFKIKSLPRTEMNKAVVEKLKSLSKEQQRQFLSLHNNFPGQHAFAGIIKTNALPCGCDSRTGGIYLTICLINHSCLPNAHNNWNGNEEYGVETIHAIKPIKAGEEITIDYSLAGPSSTRQPHLRKNFGFDCQCTVCSLPQHELESSDARRQRIQDLDDSIGDPMRMRTRPGASLADCRSLLQLSKEEYGDELASSAARLYYDAFLISVSHSDRARASVFAERAYKARVICEGEDSPSTQRMKRFMEDPTSHTRFGAYSSKWKGSDKFSPSSLNETEFDAWLWRRAD
ncbi:SET domain-containing protein [Hypoxylon sp. NC1633]|nr:SET domain-containing protein [Hypoxylon sp. NC1633]